MDTKVESDSTPIGREYRSFLPWNGLYRPTLISLGQQHNRFQQKNHPKKIASKFLVSEEIIFTRKQKSELSFLNKLA